MFWLMRGSGILGGWSLWCCESVAESRLKKKGARLGLAYDHVMISQVVYF